MTLNATRRVDLTPRRHSRAGDHVDRGTADSYIKDSLAHFHAIEQARIDAGEIGH